MAAVNGAARRTDPPSPGISEQRGQKTKQALAAITSGDWETARTLLTEIVAAEPSPLGTMLQRLARSLKMTGSFHASCREMERAYRAFVGEADHLGAGRAATFLYSMRAKLGERAPARGWEQKALRHLAHVGPCVERGYVALALTGCEVHDPAELRDRAELALTVAREFSDHDLELRAMGDKGLALVCQGFVDEGFALLDEVMVAIAAGEVADGEVRAMTVCALLTACERTGDRGRAEYWCHSIEKDPRLREIGIVITHCAIVYGCVEALRGNWESAEARLVEAAAAESSTAYHRADSIARLAELLLLQGRYAEAAGALAGFEDEFEAAPAIARLRLAEGKYDEASGLLRTVARGLGSDAIRLGPVLALLVEVELRRDDVAAATRVARRLNALDDHCGSDEIRATARLGCARVALYRGHHEEAIQDLETALTLLSQLDRPLLKAQVRLELAGALVNAGETASARVEADAALATFRMLGVAPDAAASPDLIGDLLSKDEGAAQRHGRDQTRGRLPSGVMAAGLTRREAEIARLVAEGLANRSIAARLTLSVRTVESHIDRILGKLDFHNRTQLATWMERGRGSSAVQ